MAKSLQDQLLNAGLVDSNKAKKAKADKRKQLKQQQKNKITVVDDNKAQLQKAHAEKQKKDRELNRRRQQQAEQKALAAQIKQLIQKNRQEQDNQGGEAYNFVDQGVVKRIYVSAAVREQITRGRLAIVRDRRQYELVPSAVAEKIRAHDPALVIEINQRDDKEGGEDDPYADYQIPDDLMW